VNVSAFDYDLPPELIAQFPAEQRAGSRMLVLSRQTGACELRNFSDILDDLHSGDCLVVNNTKVIPARLFGHRVPTGGRVEALVLEGLDATHWLAMLRPGRRMKPGQRVRLEGDTAAEFTVVSRRAEGTFEIQFHTP